MDTIKNVYCIGRNYVEHVQELGNVIPEKPVVFTKPTHCLYEANGGVMELPNDRGEVHYEAELVLKVGKDYERDRSLDEMISEMTIGLDLTLRDLQTELKEKEHPWLLAKGFPQSAVVGKFIPFPGMAACKEHTYTLFINREQVQLGDLNKMIFPLESLVAFIGENIGLKKGDIIYTGTPSGVGPLRNGDRIEMLWGDQVIGESTVSM